MNGQSETPTPWAIRCTGDPDMPYAGCGQVFLTEREYNRQMFNADDTWTCPSCGFGIATWDDGNYEKRIDEWESATEGNHAD